MVGHLGRRPPAPGRRGRARAPGNRCARPASFTLGLDGTWEGAEATDVVILVAHTDEPSCRRLLDVPDDGLPVPADLLVVNEAEFDAMRRRGRRLAVEMEERAVWLWPGETALPGRGH